MANIFNELNTFRQSLNDDDLKQDAIENLISILDRLIVNIKNNSEYVNKDNYQRFKNIFGGIYNSAQVRENVEVIKRVEEISNLFGVKSKKQTEGEVKSDGEVKKGGRRRRRKLRKSRRKSRRKRRR